MTPNPSPLLSADAAHVWHPFSPNVGQAPVAIRGGRGAWLLPETGEPILDAISSWWVNLHGHSHPEIADAIARQASELEHVIFAGFTHRPAVELCQRLAALMPNGPQRFFFSDDGSTAVEVALKVLIQYYDNIGQPRTRLAALRGGYHGDTFGAMSAGGESLFHRPFRPFMFEVEYVDRPTTPDAAATLAQLNALLDGGPLLGLILEPLVQGSAGMLMYPPEALTLIFEWAKRNNVKLIADEVMTGFGRTGRLFAHQHTPHTPDIICMSKGLTGGFLPMGLTGVSDEIAEAFRTSDRTKSFLHGHSYTANPLACVAALASLDILLRPETQARIAAIEAAHRAAAARLAQLPGVENVRVMGTIFALDVATPDSGYLSEVGPRLYRAALSRNVLLRPLGNTLYTLPPYCVTDDELALIHNTMAECVAEVFQK